MIIIMGIAVINTIETTYDNFLESPCIAPDVAMAAETPQMDTALDNIKPNSSSIINFLHSQKEKYHTDNTTTKDWMRPSEPALRISEKITFVPSNTKPIFTKSSADKASLSQTGSLTVLPTNRPTSRLKITASNPRSSIVLLPANSKASAVKKNTTGKPSKYGFILLPVNSPPRISSAKVKISCLNSLRRFAASNTEDKLSIADHLYLGAST